MSYTFIGDQRLIVLDPGVINVDVQDLYSRWKDWVLVGQGAQWIRAMESVGGNPIGFGNTIAPYIVMLNGWKIRPFEGNHILTISGNIITDDESNPFVDTLGNFNVTIKNVVSSNTIAVGDRYTLEEIAQEVWDYNLTNHNTAESVGNFIKTKLLRFREWFTLKDK